MSRSVRAPRYDAEDLRENQARTQEALVIYEKHPDADAYRIRGAFEPYAVVATEKRFTDAELCAEYWAARNDLAIYAIGPADVTRPREQAVTLHRFASLPHFD
jgi:hypothetical protein